jgi:hypothetical protein
MWINTDKIPSGNNSRSFKNNLKGINFSMATSPNPNELLFDVTGEVFYELAEEG